MESRNEVFHLLRQLSQQHIARWQQALPGLTESQYAVMCSVAKQPGIEQIVLIEATVSTKTTLTEMPSRTEARGPVRREHDPADKRRRFVYLIEQDEALLNRPIPQGSEIDDEFFDHPSDGGREQFTRLVRKVIAP